ncbi:MAG: 5-amino-6-(5-phosphoribosylamino)uracil reductase [Mesorhizobium sp.]|nr:5-amino-6-(5-phosphoribosylamino)uracil reductase [Mesorhizobium sp.]
MRPKIICHMVSSIDGRLLPGRWTPPAAGIAPGWEHRHYEAVAARLDADGWMVGRKSMQDFARGTERATVGVPGNLRETYVADRKGRDVAVGIDPHGRLHYGQDNAGGDHIIAVLGQHVSDVYLAELREDGVSYLFAGEDGTELHEAMRVLGEAFGIKTILLEGGGITNGTFLKAGLIDEISLLVYPGIDGLAGVPSIFEFLGSADDHPAAGKALRHFGTETLEGGVVWLRYKVEAAA